MREIILKKRYPHSREEDITDAFMRGYEKGKADRPTRVYEYLRERIGDIVDSEAEFEAWFERMVWHVEECNRLADRPQGEWIPCSERLPKDLEVVNITWINHRPMTYYADIKDKPFTATAIHYKDKWWWYSPICEDMLAEYGKSECDKMDADIEVTAWMPLPKPWKGADDESVDSN